MKRNVSEYEEKKPYQNIEKMYRNMEKTYQNWKRNILENEKKSIRI